LISLSLACGAFCFIKKNWSAAQLFH